MCNCIYERGKCKSNIDLFKEELFADVVFRFCWENESIFAHPLQDVSRYCKMNIHELLDQRATRSKIASITHKIMPHMEETKYYDFAQELLQAAQDVSMHEWRPWKYDRDNPFC